MSMFTRNEKTPEKTPEPARSAVSTAPERHETPAAPEAKRPQAVAQPIAHPAPSAVGVSVISKALKITGQLESTENIQIDGEIEGDVRGASVKVGHGAKVKGTVYADEIELSGAVDGKLEARKVVLTNTARMTGDVVHSDLTIQSGAYMSGHCRPEYGAAATAKSDTGSKPL